MDNNVNVSGKILLFGEYTVLHGGRALAIPADKWVGRWVDETPSGPDHVLLEWANFLNTRGIWNADSVQRMLADIHGGLCFQSSIPTGYGLGSSGALTAAAYRRYRTRAADLADVRKELAAMEAFFHGSSSGMDPLVSLLNRAVLREGNRYYRLDARQLEDSQAPFVFLVDSGKTRQTRQLVNAYQSMQKDQTFIENVTRPMMQASDHAIGCFLDKQWELFWQFLNVVSELQFQYLTEFIPDSIRQMQSEVISHEGLCLKFCGAGGGGMFLGFARSQGLLDAVRNRPDVIILS